MRRSVVLLVVLVAAYVVLDVVAKGYVEARVEREFRDRATIQVDGVSFAIDSFPFLARLGAFSEVSATLELEGIDEQGVRLDTFRLEVDGLVFDRRSAFNGRVRVTDLDTAVASVSITEATISEESGVAVDLAADGTVSAGGVSLQVDLSPDGIVLAGGGFGPVTVPVRLGRYLPCEPDLVLADDRATLSCATSELPPIVNQVLGEAGARLRG